MSELCSIYNGIGPDAFPEWLRNTISALHPSLAVVAFIHDCEWHESDCSKEKFAASNDRFGKLHEGIASFEKIVEWVNPADVPEPKFTFIPLTNERI